MSDNLSKGMSKKLAFKNIVHYALGACCTMLLAGLTGLTVVDVVGRYFFSAPVSGAFELTQLMLAALIFSALPLTTLAGEHVEVDIFFQMAPEFPKKIMRILGAVVSAISLWVISWRLAHHAAKLAQDVAVTDALNLPLAPVGWLGAVMAAVSGVLALFYLAYFSLADEMIDSGRAG